MAASVPGCSNHYRRPLPFFLAPFKGDAPALLYEEPKEPYVSLRTSLFLVCQRLRVFDREYSLCSSFPPSFQQATVLCNPQ